MFCTLVFACCAGCLAQLGGDYNAYLHDPQAERVALQICLPDRTSFFDEISVDVTDFPDNTDPQTLAALYAAAKPSATQAPRAADQPRVYETLDKWLAPLSPAQFPKPFVTGGTSINDGYVISEAGFTAYLLGATQTHQSVFYYFTSVRAKDIVAIHVLLSVRRDGALQDANFWYTVPAGLQKNLYSDWVAPVSEEKLPWDGDRKRAPIMLKLTHGAQLPIYLVGEHAPRVRFTISTGKEDGYLTKDFLRARHAAALALKQAGLPYAWSDNVVFVPGRQATIPSCNE